jgi:hypothetical protein
MHVVNASPYARTRMLRDGTLDAMARATEPIANNARQFSDNVQNGVYRDNPAAFFRDFQMVQDHLGVWRGNAEQLARIQNGHVSTGRTYGTILASLPAAPFTAGMSTFGALAFNTGVAAGTAGLITAGTGGTLQEAARDATFAAATNLAAFGLLRAGGAAVSRMGNMLSRPAATLGNTAAQEARGTLQMAASQLQSKFKHAGDFGIAGNFNRANATAFENAIRTHVNNEATQVIQGTYRGQEVLHFLDPRTGLNVITDRAGQFISGWRLSAAQLQHVLANGRLGGG